MKIEEIEKLMRKMIYEDVLIEKSVKCSKKFKMTKIEQGSKSNDLKAKKLKIFVPQVSEGKSLLCQTSKKSMTEGIKENKSNNFCKPEENFRKNRNSSESSKKSLIFQDFKENYDSFTKASFIHEFKPRIPYEKNIEIVLDSPFQPHKKIDNSQEDLINLINTPAIVLKSKDNNELDSDLHEELKSRLKIVRKKLSRQLKSSEESVLPDHGLDLLAKTMKGLVHPDFLKEIEYFKSINQINSQNDLEKIEFSSLIRIQDSENNPKRLKLIN